MKDPRQQADNAPNPAPARASRVTQAAWVLYDCANSAFALIMLTAIYPRVFKEFHASGLSNADSTFWYGLSASAASLIIAVLAPFLGSIADLGSRRVRWLASFASLGIVSTVALFFVGEGQWVLASALYMLGVTGFAGGNLFYDALLVIVAPRGERHRLSALGFSAGYLGSVLLLLACAFVLIPQWETFGFADKWVAVRFSFILTAVWWLLFSLPAFFLIREPRERDALPFSTACRRGLSDLRQTATGVWRHPGARWFLLAYFFYIDGVNTVIKMAAPLASDLGIPASDLMTAIIVVQVVGVPCAFIIGALADRFGARRLLLLCIACYLGVTVYAARMSAEPLTVAGLAISPILILALLIGMVQGGVQSLSRSYFANLVPSEHAASWFGFYNIVGRSAAVLGPAMVGVTARLLDDAQAGIASIALLFIAGGLILLFRAPKHPSESEESEDINREN